MSSIDLTGRFAEWRDKFDGLIWRERLLVGVTLLSLVWMIWTYALQDYIDKERSKTISGITGAQAQLSAAVQEQRLLSGGDVENDAALEHLRESGLDP